MIRVLLGVVAWMLFALSAWALALAVWRGTAAARRHTPQPVPDDGRYRDPRIPAGRPDYRRIAWLEAQEDARLERELAALSPPAPPDAASMCQSSGCPAPSAWSGHGHIDGRRFTTYACAQHMKLEVDWEREHGRRLIDWTPRVV